jgi:hypothetical protein
LSSWSPKLWGPAVKQRVASRANAGRGRRKLEKFVWVREGPAGGMVRRNPVCGPMGCSGPVGPERSGASSHASGQISAKSSRGRVISPTLAACFSRQRSLNRSPAFSTVIASHHAPHWLSSLANTR